jgi:multimeric flavodoxin WrbA
MAGNPAAALLSWMETAWAPYWESGELAGKLGATFATGGGLAQGVEHVITSLQRTLLSFNLELVASSPTSSAYASYGAVAVTGGPYAKVAGLAPEFVAAGKALGAHVAEQAAAKAWLKARAARKCDGSGA